MLGFTQRDTHLPGSVGASVLNMRLNTTSQDTPILSITPALFLLYLSVHALHFLLFSFSYSLSASKFCSLFHLHISLYVVSFCFSMCWLLPSLTGRSK